VGVPTPAQMTAITSAATAVGVPPSLALAVANQESGFNQSAIGSSGEVGIFQLMPGTAAQLGVNPYDESENIQGGVSYLSQLLTQFGGDPSLALAAYNAGPGRVQTAVSSSGSDWFSAIPASTQSYVSSVLASSGATGINFSPTDPDDLGADAYSDSEDSSFSGASSLDISDSPSLLLAAAAALLGIFLFREFA
jgi:Transglycosylase SLT domain